MTFLITNTSITVLSCPLILYWACFKGYYCPVLTFTWLLRTSTCMSNFDAISAFRYLCVLPSSNRVFMIKLLPLFSTMIGTVCNEIASSADHCVLFPPPPCCSSPSMRDFFYCCTELCSNSSSWLALRNILFGWHCVTFYCAYSKIHLFCKWTPKCILQLCNLLPNKKNTTREFLQFSIFVFYSYF